jgi:FtsP/CotA-like multicopper oxidase with cupredoxin domain
VANGSRRPFFNWHEQLLVQRQPRTMQRQFFVSRALLGCLLLLAVAVVLSSQSQASSLAAPVRAFDFVLRWKWLAPDGFWRPVITVNDQFPGPLIEVNEGDNVVLTVHNELMLEQTTVHFHGLTMKGTPFMDGAAFVTQVCIHTLLISDSPRLTH